MVMADGTHTNSKWTCQHCLRNYSKHYKHKLHLSKCLVCQSRCNRENDIMSQMKDEVKDECIKLFQHMMQDFKHNVPVPSYRAYKCFALVAKSYFNFCAISAFNRSMCS